MKAPLNPRLKRLFTDPTARRDFDKQVRRAPMESSGIGRLVTVRKSTGEVVELRSIPAMTPSQVR